MKGGWLILCCLAVAQGMQKRGVVEEFSKLFDGLNVGFDQVQRAAENEMSKFKPWAETLEREMKPAMDRVEERLGSALDTLGMTFGQDRVDSHVMNTNGNAHTYYKIALILLICLEMIKLPL